MGVAGAVLAVAVVTALVLRPTDESRIRAQLTLLAKTVRITEADAQTSPVARLARVHEAFDALFEPDVRVSIPELPSLRSGRRDLAEAVTSAPRVLRSFDVDFADVTLALDESRTTARVQTTARVTAVDREGDASKEARAVDLRFARKDGEWRVHTLTVWSTGDASP